MPTYNIQNPPVHVEPGSFRAIIDSYGSLAKSCRYFVMIGRNNIMNDTTNTNSPFTGSQGIINDLSYLCEATEFPGRSFNMVDVRYYGPNQKLPIQTVYEDINMTFLCRSGSYEREFFDDWIEAVNPSSTYDFNYRDDYSSEITLFQMTDHETSVDSNIPATTYEFTLENAFPIMVNPQPVTWADDNFQRLTVTFTYFRWRRANKEGRIIYTPPPNLGLPL